MKNTDIYMNKADLKRHSKSELIKLLLKQNAESTPKPSIKQMVKQSDLILVDDKPVSTTGVSVLKMCWTSIKLTVSQ